MVHNGIEYGIMAAYAEGLNILRHANAGNAGARGRRRDRAASPPRALPVRPRTSRDIAEVWRRGSVIGSWLLDLTAAALKREPRPQRVHGPRVRLGRRSLDAQGGHRRGRAGAGLDTALTQRFASRGEEDFANKVLSAMRYQFGGHEREALDGATPLRRMPWSSSARPEISRTRRSSRRCRRW